MAAHLPACPPACLPALRRWIFFRLLTQRDKAALYAAVSPRVGFEVGMVMVSCFEVGMVMVSCPAKSVHACIA